MKSMRWCWIALAFVACSDDMMTEMRDAGPTDAATIPDECTDAMACTLVPGTRATDYVYPVGDSDRWTFDVQAGRIVNIVVENDIEFSPIRLEVVLFGPDGSALDNQRFQNNGRQRVVIQRAIDAGGAHAVVVRDVGGDGQDKAPYYIQVDILEEADPNEPNDTAAEAIPLTPGTAVNGAIGSQGDQDWFYVDVAANELIQIDMVAPGLSDVRLRWTLLNPAADTDIAVSREPTTDVPWRTENRAVGNAMGRYLIRVDDDPMDGAQADLARIYTLTVRLLQEPDANERASQNDTANRPTMVTAGQQITGYIASVSDFDFYAIQVTGAPRLITATAQMPMGTAVDLSIAVLANDGNLLICEQELGDECQALRFHRDGAMGAASLTTSHVAREDGLYFVQVRDLQDNDYDDAIAYTLTIDLPADPDGPENYADGRGSARLVQPSTSTAGTTIQWPWTEGYISYAGDADWFAFEIPGDAAPSPGQNGDWELQFELQMAPTAVELEAFFFGEQDSPRERYQGYGKRCRNDGMITQQDPEPCQYPAAENAQSVDTGGVGSSECFVVFREVTRAGPHYFRMSDLQRDDYDIGASGRYQFRITARAGCAVPGQCEGIYEQNGADLCGRP